ncbi:Rrf2 family transcriptional regulator [Faecalibacillus faecis]|uniref:Rrf2 family transcriptional regulator n=2 Tax=Faecalibacillus faecis TaxID=1982628 RepID=A0A2T3FPI3_9FIRM|nr:Rrf2 family transcriptional regulator [Faecalibacillus faecis]
MLQEYFNGKGKIYSVTIMQFTMTTDYALRIVTYLSQKGDVVTTSQLSNELQIPMNYIPKIIKNLKNKKIIYAIEGVKGGYRLAKKPKSITLLDVILATETTMSFNKCLETNGTCSKNCQDSCAIRKILESLQNDMIHQLEKVTFSDLINKEFRDNI